jgi:hypothetical protein
MFIERKRVKATILARIIRRKTRRRQAEYLLIVAGLTVISRNSQSHNNIFLEEMQSMWYKS